MKKFFLLSSLKTRLVPSGAKPRVLLGGLCKGLKMQIDLRHQTQAYLGLYEREVRPWMLKLSKGIQTAFDVGTAEGYYSIFLACRAGARVIAVDADENTRPFFLENMRLNGLKENLNFTHHSAFAGNQNSGGCRSLDSLSDRLSGPFLIKMDIEGAEAEVLKGAARLLSGPDTRWIIETHSLKLEEECLGILKAAGYQTQIIPNAWWRTLLPEKRFGHNRWIAATKKI